MPGKIDHRPLLRSRGFALVAFLVLASTTRAGAIAPPLHEIPISEDYVLRTWEMDDGLPSNRILGIAQTPDGYLWLGTVAGLTRFDGARFTTFSSRTTPELDSTPVRSVFVSSLGTLWVGHDSGAIAARANGELFETIIPPLRADSAHRIVSFAEDKEGGIWFAGESPNQIGHWRSGRLTLFAREHGVASGAQMRLGRSADGKIWHENSNGCAVFDGQRFRPIDPAGGGWPHLTPARAGGMWAKRGTQLLRYAADGAKEIVAEIGDLSVHTLFEDSEGNLWLGTNNAGLIRFRDGAFARVPVPGAGVSVIAEDRERNLWIGTHAGGLSRLRARQLFLHQTDDGLTDNEIYSVAEDADGAVWIAGRNRTLVRVLGAGERRFVTLPGWPGNRGNAMTLCPDPAGGMWIGTLRGLVRWQEEQWNDAPLRDPITALLRDGRGDLWAATIPGALVRGRAGKFETLPADDGLLKALALAEDRSGHIWVGTEAGLVFRGRDGRFERVPLPDATSSGRIHFIVPEADDTVWIGALHGGLYRWRKGRVDAVPQAIGIPLHDPRSLAIGPAGDFWISTSQGLFHTLRSEIDAVIEKRQSSIRFLAYDRNDGLPTGEFAFGFRNTVARTRDGRLWFATERGALEIIPRELPKENALARVLIEEVTIDGAPSIAAKRGPLIVPPGAGLVQVRYTLPHLSRPEKIGFRYRLVGSGSGAWTSAGTQRAATFARLPHGEYRFEVTAAEPGGPWLESATASVDFTVQASWWETTSFRVAAATALLAGLIWLVRTWVLLRVRRRLRKLEQERALERERTRIARDIHDQLGASLTQIAITSKLLMLDRPEQVAAHSAEIAAIARRTVESLDEIVWAVDPVNDTLSTLADYLGEFAVNFFAAAGIECEVDIPTDLPGYPLPAAVRHHLFLAVKEAMNNAVKHSSATRARLSIHVERTQVRIEICDHGRGFPSSAGDTSTASGVANMQARMTEIGGGCRIETSPEQGTRIIFEVELREERMSNPS